MVDSVLLFVAFVGFCASRLHREPFGESPPASFPKIRDGQRWERAKQNVLGAPWLQLRGGAQGTVVLAAGHADGTTGQAALAEICRAYWQPLYAVARRLGHSPAVAEDLTQGFFTELLERPILERADAARGHFRSYLLGAFKNHLGKERRHDCAQKRGGAQRPLSLETGKLESRLVTELGTQRTPEAIYERTWAVALMEEAMHRLESECHHAGRKELFQKLQPCLGHDSEAGHYAEIARSLGKSEATVQVMVSRMRRRYLELLRSVILPTVGRPEEVEDELRHLLQVLSE